MGKRRTIYRCSGCGAEAPQWAGRCPGCGAWNSLVEEVATDPQRRGGRAGRGGRAHAGAARASEPATPLTQLTGDAVNPWPTGLAEVDRVLDGGLTPGSVTLVAGEPGMGKSTLLLQVASSMARRGLGVLYVSAEESREQVRRRAERLGVVCDQLWLAGDPSLDAIVDQLDDVGPQALIVDSVQTVFDPEIDSAPGSVVQVRECSHRLVAEARSRGLAAMLVGHVTKDGAIAGPRLLEHVVDTVLSLEGDRHHALRLLRAVKHRFGSTLELGVFEMTDRGLAGVADAGRLFLADRQPGVTGSALVPTLDGRRPLVVELQALVAPSSTYQPRRSSQGLDAGRLAVILAVLERRAGLALSRSEVFALAVGGVRVVEPGADLALALAVASSHLGSPLPDGLVACAEIGLGGELRHVAQLQPRLAEAARLGFRAALVARSAPARHPHLDVLRAASVSEAISRAGLAPSGSSRSTSTHPEGRQPRPRPHLQPV
jgi:DNA repair protein RadA/Sms